MKTRRLHTWSETRKRLVEVILFQIEEDIVRLRANLLVCAKNDDEEPTGRSISKQALSDEPVVYLVYDKDTRQLWYLAASTSVQCPRMEAAIDAAAERAPVMAR